MTRKALIGILIVLVLAVAAGSCGIYGFSGASIPPDAKTVSILSFPNNAELVQPTLSQVLTEALRDKFNQQTNLMLVPANGDLQLEGEITGYETEPLAIAEGTTAQLIRLKITVNVRYNNTKNQSQNFESSFMRYKDYPADRNLASVEQGLIKDITAELVEDIFNKSVVNW